MKTLRDNGIINQWRSSNMLIYILVPKEFVRIVPGGWLIYR